MYGVILAGGRGKRFWPASSSSRPKQFLDLTGGGSMLSLTWRRLAGFIDPGHILVLTAGDLRERVRGELPALPPGNLIAEPAPRNTAPALALAAAIIRARGEDEPCLCCPADHLIADEAAFERVASAAAAFAAERNALVTFGIAPTGPATGYGYIERGEEAAAAGETAFYRVRRFHEKPDRRRAEEYLAAGGCYWNSGIFVWRPAAYLEAWARFLPAGERPLGRVAESLRSGGVESAMEREYPSMPSISVDYGILEKAPNVFVAPADLGWSDVGSWDSLFDTIAPDAAGTVARGRSLAIDARRNLLYHPGGTIAVIGVDDVIVVVDGPSVLVCRRGESQRVREITEALEREGTAEQSEDR